MNKTTLLEIMNGFIGWSKTSEFTSYKFSDENAANEFSEITGGIIYGPFSSNGFSGTLTQQYWEVTIKN